MRSNKPELETSNDIEKALFGLNGTEGGDTYGLGKNVRPPNNVTIVRLQDISGCSLIVGSMFASPVSLVRFAFCFGLFDRPPGPDFSGEAGRIGRPAQADAR